MSKKCCLLEESTERKKSKVQVFKRINSNFAFKYQLTYFMDLIEDISCGL